MKSSLKYPFLIAAAAAGLMPGALASSIDVYIGAPGLSGQTSPIAGSTTASFDGVTVGTYTSLVTSIGTYTSSSAFAVQAADQFGGANGSRYFVFGAQTGSASPVTLTFSGAQTYFGMWWSAGDANNGITLYRNGVSLARFSTATILTILNTSAAPSTVTAVNGSTYTKSSYFGNPNTSQDAAEPFAYLMFFGNGLTFDKIVFDNSNSTASGFESDNHSIFAGSVSVPGTSVFVQKIATPEPATGVAVGLSLGLLLVASRRAGILNRKKAG